MNCLIIELANCSILPVVSGNAMVTVLLLTQISCIYFVVLQAAAEEKFKHCSAAYQSLCDKLAVS